MIRIFKTLIRISSFLGKEMTEIFRQPRLILTLVLGPFLIMFLFGLGYPDQSRTLRTTFVVTDPDTFQEEMNRFTKSFNSTLFDYVIVSDKERALAKLALDQTDLVIVVPEVPFETIKNNQQAEFLIFHNEVDPLQIGYIHSVARIFVDELNRQILQSVAEQGQADSGSLQTDLETAIVKTQALRQAVPAEDINTATQAAALEQDLTNVHEKLTTFRSLAPGILVSPFSAKITGLFEVQLTVTGFFAPAVIVLLLQHVSITFASLSIVRETRSGIMELFRVAPIKAFETLVGKYLSYLFFETILAGVITALAVWLLKIPILGRLQDYALAVVILLFTSLGVGFLISLISQTDTQAVQYSMLLMLASIFFSGFFLDLRLMKAPITVLAWSLPATYGIRMLQDIMLRGASVPLLVFLGTASIGIVLFLINWILLRKKWKGNLMKKQVGLWIDHRKAVIVLLKDVEEEIKKIKSNMEKHVRFTSGGASDDGSSEDVRDRQFGNHLNSYYDEVIAYIRGADSIQIFGPGEAKGELEKRLEHSGLKEHILAIETVDKLTDRQISAKVREHFIT